MVDYIKLVEEYGYPLYVYEEHKLLKRVKLLKYMFEDFSLFYSLKANPNKMIIKTLSDQGLGADCASSGEVKLALSCGISAGDILYSSPGKTLKDIEDSYKDSVIIADSLGELSLLNEFFDKKTKIGVRINPLQGFLKEKAFETMGGGSSKFGIDEEQFFSNLCKINNYENINIVGMHVYLGSGILDEQVILENVKNIFEIAERFDNTLEFIDFGGGLGVPYEYGQKELDVDMIRKGIKELVSKYANKDTRLIIESGRYLAAQCGKYLTRVIDIKESRGETYYIIYGGMNGFFRPAFTGTKHKVFVHNDSDIMQTVTVAGHLCTPIDVMAKDVTVKKARPGDVLEVSDAGTYGFTMSLKEFISHSIPIELYIDLEGRISKC